MKAKPKYPPDASGGYNNVCVGLKLAAENIMNCSLHGLVEGNCGNNSKCTIIYQVGAAFTLLHS